MKVLHQDATAESLAFLRFYVFGLWLLEVVLEPMHLLGYLPRTIFEPIGVLRLVPAGAYSFVFDPTFFHFLKAATIVSLVLALIGPFRKSGAVAACFFLTFYQGFHRGLTFTNHAELSLLYAALILTAFDLAGVLHRRLGGSVHPNVNLNALPIQMIAGIMTLAYCFIGTHRLVFGGVELLRTDSLTFWIVQACLPCNQDAFDDIARLSLEHPLLRHLLNGGFALSTVFEVLAPFTLVFAAFRRAWLVVMLGFHLTVHFFMKISFWENVLLYIAFIEYHPWVSARAPLKDRPLVFFDGVCALCNRFVAMVISRDPHRIFRFAPLEGATSRERLGEPPDDSGRWSMVLVDEAGIHRRSEAVLRVLSRLGGPWRLLGILRWVPRPLRDLAYDLVANHRRRLTRSGAGAPGEEACEVPAAADRERFLP